MLRSPRVRLPLATAILMMLGLVAGKAAAAQEATPSLTARVGGINSNEARSEKLVVQKLELDVRVHGTVAETTMTVRFSNTGRQALEGDFRLLMPNGSALSGYALDINGQMVDGVLVDQRRARLAYEARVRQNIDPGLGEVDRGNIFRTRVFPIFPQSGRTVRVSFATPLDPRVGYVLPIRDTGIVGDFSLNLTVSGTASPPAVRLPAGLREAWTQTADGHRLSVRSSNLKLDGNLELAWAQPAAAMLVSRHDNGERFFQITDDGDARRRGSEPVRSVAVLWDRSLSRADDDHAEEIAVLQQYLQRVRPDEIELLLFDSGGVERHRARSAASLLARLRTVRYRGATSFAVLAGERLADVDACLLFSDGLVTIDRREGFQPQCPLFALSSAADADQAWLGALAGRTGGEAYDLTAREAGDVIMRMTRGAPRVISVTSAAGEPIDYSLLDGGESGWRIVGPMPASGNVIVRFAGLRGETRRAYSPAGPVADLDAPATLWASERAALLAAADERDRQELVDFSRRYRVASPDISFIVLETGRDYAMARFAPPASLPAALRDEYARVREQLKEAETRERSGRLQLVLSQWEEMQRWWATRFDPSRAPKPVQGSEPRPVPSIVPMVAPPAPQEAVRRGAADAAREGETVVVTGSRIGGPGSGPGASSAPGATILVDAWQPDRPYLAALEAAPSGQIERVFAEQQRLHGGLPAFWLDVADWTFRRGRREEALQLLLSALELPTRNSETLAVVAERLMRYGQVDRAIWLYERLLAAEDDRPQPRRTLALALAKRAETAPRHQAREDLARALSLLTDVVMTPRDNAYQGIEMIALMEANRLIPRYRALGGQELALDPRLIALLDVDMRVVIEWNTEATDIDLWVDEPTRERAIYSNPRTAIGGRLSRDMTRGYGPEEYLLRRAPDGTYEVRAQVFAADRINPNGAQWVTARLIRDFGRPTEREEVVDLELLPNDTSRERRIGRVVFGREAAVSPASSPRRPRRGAAGGP